MRAWRAAVSLILVLLAPAGLLHARYIRQWDVRQLLGASSVYHVTRDSKGFLWFSTNHGLARYDGHSFRKFTRSKGLPTDVVFNIYEDRSGRIWPFCANGEFCFIRGDSLHTRQTDAWLAGFPEASSYLVAMVDGRDSSLLFGLRTKSILRADRHGAALLETHTEGYNRIIIRNDTLMYSPTLGMDIYTGDRRYHVELDSPGIRISKDGELIWSKVDNQLTYLTVNDACITAEGVMLLATMHGLKAVDLRTGAQETLLSRGRITSCELALDGTIWLTTEDRVYAIHRELDGLNPLPDHELGRWSSTASGGLMGVKSGTLYNLETDPAGAPVVVAQVGQVPGYFDPVFTNSQFSVFYNTWVRSSNVLFHDQVSKHAPPITYRHPGELFFIKNLFGISAGEYFGYGDRTFYRFSYAPHNLRITDTVRFPDKIVSATQEQRTGDVYFVSGNVLYSAAAATGQIGEVLKIPKTVVITSILAHDGCLYGITDGSSLYVLRLKPGPDRVRVYKLGFPLMNIFPLTGGSMILESDQSSYIFRPRTGRPELHKIQYPIASSHFEKLSVVGRSCVVQLQGRLYAFDTALLNSKPQPAKVYVKGIQVNGKPWAKLTPAKGRGSMNLRLTADVLNFHDALPELKYRLVTDTRTDDWISVAEPEIALTLNESGQYRLDISASDDPSSDFITAMHIDLRERFVGSLWFYLLVLASVLILVAGCTALIVSFRRRQFSKELNYVRLENRAINALLNPHFIFNSINNIQGLINRASTRQAAEYLAILSRLIRQNLENLQRDVIPMKSELTLIRHYVQLQNLRHSDHISIEICGAGEVEDILIPPLLIHTCVENAIVHGYVKEDQSLHVSVRFSRLENERLMITVTDDGVGIDPGRKRLPTKARQSYGIAFNQRRLRRLSDFCRVEQSITLQDRSDGARGAEAIIIISTHLDVLLGQPEEMS